MPGIYKKLDASIQQLLLRTNYANYENTKNQN